MNLEILNVKPRISEDEEGNAYLILEVDYIINGCTRVINYSVESIEDCATKRIMETVAAFEGI